MPRFVLDSDHVTELDHGHPGLLQRLARQSPGSVCFNAVSLQEALVGRLAALARHPSGPRAVQSYLNLKATLALFQRYPVVDYDGPSDGAFQQLRLARVRIGTQDLKIAAIALTQGLILLTRNRQDFSQVPGLVFDDWTV